MSEIKNKRAQEEIVGFVAIVLIVSIILIVFLGIFLRKDKSGPGNIEVSQFLDAIMETTTSCSTDGFTYKTYSDLVKICNEGSDCSGENACDILYEYTEEMIENSWKFGDDNVKIGYKYSICFKPDNSDTCTNFQFLGREVCILSERNKREISANGGNIITEFELCLKS